jgi:hypothetical protein
MTKPLEWPRFRAESTVVEAKKSRRIDQILRLFIGDTPARASIDDDVINDT